MEKATITLSCLRKKVPILNIICFVIYTRWFRVSICPGKKINREAIFIVSMIMYFVLQRIICWVPAVYNRSTVIPLPWRLQIIQPVHLLFQQHCNSMGSMRFQSFTFAVCIKKISQVGQNLQRTCTFVRLGGSILHRLSITRLSHRFYQRSVCLSLFWHGASLAPTRSI